MRVVAERRMCNSTGTTTTHCLLALLSLVAGVNDTIFRAYSYVCVCVRVFVCRVNAQKENAVTVEERRKKVRKQSYQN